MLFDARRAPAPPGSMLMQCASSAWAPNNESGTRTHCASAGSSALASAAAAASPRPLKPASNATPGCAGAPPGSVSWLMALRSAASPSAATASKSCALLPKYASMPLSLQLPALRAQRGKQHLGNGALRARKSCAPHELCGGLHAMRANLRHCRPGARDRRQHPAAAPLTGVHDESTPGHAATPDARQAACGIQAYVGAPAASRLHKSRRWYALPSKGTAISSRLARALNMSRIAGAETKLTSSCASKMTLMLLVLAGWCSALALAADLHAARARC